MAVGTVLRGLRRPDVAVRRPIAGSYDVGGGWLTLSPAFFQGMDRRAGGFKGKPPVMARPSPCTAEKPAVESSNSG